jgi:hypothetical protein
VLLDAVVQLPREAIAFLDHSQGSYLVGQPGVAGPNPGEILIILLEVLNQQIESIRDNAESVVRTIVHTNGQPAAHPNLRDLIEMGDPPVKRAHLPSYSKGGQKPGTSEEEPYVKERRRIRKYDPQDTLHHGSGKGRNRGVTPTNAARQGWIVLKRLWRFFFIHRGSQLLLWMPTRSVCTSRIP